MVNQDTNFLEKLGIKSFNKMQIEAQQAIHNYSEVIIIAPTGSGKTLAFLYPIFQQLISNTSAVQCLVISPTRELCLQIEQVWKKMSTGFKVNTCYGGHSMQIEIKDLKVPPVILIGTPGRVADHIRRNTFHCNEVSILVLDEFDKSLELRFKDEMEFIIKELKNIKNKILLSATNLDIVPAFVGLKNIHIVNYSKVSNQQNNLKLQRVISEEKDKLNTLYNLICNLKNESALIFCNHRAACERAILYLKEKKIAAAIYHGGMEQVEREKALVKFRNGSVNYLITTDLAARGIDIPEMNHVIHYQLPLHENEFIHRNGRTARMNAKGNAYIMLSIDEKQPAYIKETLNIFKLSTIEKLPEKALYTTISISGGKKNKINKVDIVGAFIQKGNLTKSDIGLIEVKDYNSFVAVNSDKVKELLKLIEHQKIKGNKYKIAIAKDDNY